MHEPLKAGFTSDRVVVGVILRSVERYNLTSENQTATMSKQNTHCAYDSVAYDQVKTTLSESQAEAEE